MSSVVSAYLGISCLVRLHFYTITGKLHSTKLNFPLRALTQADIDPLVQMSQQTSCSLQQLTNAGRLRM